MSYENLKQLLVQFRDGSVSMDQIIDYIARLPFEDIGFAKVDHHREFRWGFPEVLFCERKLPEQVVAIIEKIINRGSNILATRANNDHIIAITKRFPNAVVNSTARTVRIMQNEPAILPGKVLVVTAGTSDMPVAEEALETAMALGIDISSIHDIGVSGIHRVMHFHDELNSASVIIVIAGMEGALPSVIAGLVKSPVIAVPSSVGYGTSFGGLTAMLSMLNSCVPGIAVMNIDNGYGAAFMAFRILNTVNALNES